MTVITVNDLHVVADPDQALATAANMARVEAGSDHSRIVVRVPDRATNAVRVFTARDIVQLLQRHGRVLDVNVTGAGTIVGAADVCARRGNVAIWTGQAIGPWHPSDILQRGLGGSETAAVRLGEQLAAMGYVVTLYGHFDAGGMAGDLVLRPFQEFDPTEPLDVLVGFRNATLFDERPNADFCALWLEDLSPAEGLTPARAANIDRICGVTHFHKGQILGVHPWLDERQVAPCRNGIVHEYFEHDGDLQREPRVVYSSSPDRGGDIILECWPRIREQVPDAQLVLTYARWFDLVAEGWKKAGDFREHLIGMLQQPGVSRIEGGLGQRALARLMMTSRVWVHPSWYSDYDHPDGTKGAQFHETSCISAMEAQAAGCVVVASNWGALTETVQYGTLIDGDPREKEGTWRDAFVDAVVKGLTDENVQAASQTLGPEMVKDMDWRGAAEQLAAMFPVSSRRRS